MSRLYEKRTAVTWIVRTAKYELQQKEQVDRNLLSFDKDTQEKLQSLLHFDSKGQQCPEHQP